jgi:hypothetical protein
MKQLLIISVLLLSLASCNKNKTKKDPLEGNVAFLEGSWDWQWTRHLYDYCDPQVSGVDTIFANSVQDTYSLNFLQEGIIEYYKNDILIEEKHICFKTIIEEEEKILFDIWPNEDHDFLHGCVWRDDSLFFGGFPYRFDEGCNLYVNCFTKE